MRTRARGTPVEIGLDPRFRRGQALAKARSATSAVDPDGEATISSHGSAPFRRYPKLAVRDPRVELDIAAQVEAVGDVVGVT
jgi:hypothetical protein